jgi:hypothetical protein
MLLALLWAEALEHGVRAGAAGARRAIDLTTLEGGGCRIQGDGEPEKGPAAEAGVRALLEVRQKPGIDSSSFRKLFGAEAELGPAMRDAAGQVADSDPSRFRRPLRIFDTGAEGRGAPSPLSWSC